MQPRMWRLSGSYLDIAVLRLPATTWESSRPRPLTLPRITKCFDYANYWNQTDHRGVGVTLKEAHESGGFDWDADRRRDYANDLSDPNTLIAVDRGLNRQKGAGDPAEWLPPNKAYLVEYAEAWVAVKRKWGLTADAREIAALRKILGPAAELPMLAEECAGTMVNPESVSSVPAQVDCQAKRYCTQMKTCAEARAYLTQCNTQSLDRDGDGIPCEALCD